MAQLRDDQDVVHAEFLAPAGEQIQDVAYDDSVNALWVLTNKFVHYVDLTTGVITWTHGEKNFERIRLLDGEGAWIADDKQLIKLSTTGQALNFFDYAQPGNLVEFVVDGADGSLWIASQQYLRHYSPSGIILSELVLVSDTNQGRLWSLDMYIDDLPPTVRFVTPAEGTLTNNNLLPFLLEYSDVGIGTDPTTIAFVINDAAAGFQCSEQDQAHADCLPLQALPEGANHVSATVADFNGNVSSPADVNVRVDTISPAIIVDVPQDGAVVAASLVTVSGHLSEPATLQVNGQLVSVDTGLGFSTDVAVVTGLNTIELIATDAAGNSSQFGLTVELQPPNALPPDPAEVATAIDPSRSTIVYESTRFLYTGEDPIQTEVEPGAISPRRVAVLRGRVLDREGLPLPGVTIRAHGYPEYGTTLSRADGTFDLVVNGGGRVTVAYEKPGYPPVHRAIEIPWRDFRWLPDVVMTEFDDRVTHIDLTSTAPMQTARGNTSSDADGTRTATVMFPAGLSAEMVLPDGSRQALPNLDVRATEYTVGEAGRSAMPGELPPTSGYTYAVELSVDEAVNAGAKSVEFSQPLPTYVDNFLNFPVGIDVPSGFYDLDQARWIPSEDGRIVQILNVVNGRAVLDVTGSGTDATSSDLAELEITDAELNELAHHYEIGDSLWRVPIPHFTSWDFNWPYTFPADAEAPSEDVKDGDPEEDDTTDCTGSIVECQNQVLGEEAGVAGTPFTLNYRSNRVPGCRAAYRLDIPITDEAPPASLKRVEVAVGIVGRQFSQTFTADPNQSWDFEWDGKDAYGRYPLGGQTASIFIDYVYDGVYVNSREEFEQSFAEIGDIERPIPGSSRDEVIMQRQIAVPIGAWDARIQGLGGWTLSDHHAYEVARRQVFLGTGQTRRAVNLNEVATRYAGHPDMPIQYGGDGGVALEAGFLDTSDMAIADDGDVYIVDHSDNRIRKVDAGTGDITTFAGNGGSDCDFPSFCLKDGPATETQVPDPTAVAIGPEGNIYILSSEGLAKVTPDGMLMLVKAKAFFSERDLAVDQGGNAYVSVGHGVEKIAPDGTVSIFAGDPGVAGYSGDGGSAPDALLFRPSGLAIGPDNSVYIADTDNDVVRRVMPNGVIERVAGIPGMYNYSGDGGPAMEAEFRSPTDLAFDRDGNLYIGDTWNHAVRKVKPDGTIVSVAGIGGPDWDNCFFPTDEEEEHCLEGTYARHFSLEWLHGLAIGHEGELFVVDNSKRQVWRIDRPFPEFTDGEIVVPSEDGNSIYVFGPDGKHLRTVDVVTGTSLLQFAYGPQGFLSTISDQHGNVTTIDRDEVGVPLAVVGPFGQETTLGLDTARYLKSVANPLGETQAFNYQNGLMQTRQDAKGHISTFVYDSDGRLVSDIDPVGGGWILSRENLANGYEVATSSAAGWDIKHRVEREDDGTWSQISNFPSGGSSMRLKDPSGTVQSTSADDVIMDTRLAPHPKLGPAVPYVAEAMVSLPGGQSLNLERSVQYSGDSAAAFGEHNIDDTVTVNGRVYQSHFDAASRTWTRTSPEGRTAFVQLNAQGQAVSSQLGALELVNSAHDTRGRVIGITQGTRNLSLGYDAAGFLSEVVDAELRPTTIVTDRVGRTRELYLPGDRLVTFNFDANGNVTGITPPERPTHDFEYNGVDLATRYSPPPVTASDGPTETAYRLDRAVGDVTRADGGAVDLYYGPQSGLLLDISAPQSSYSYTYLPDSDRVASATGPAGQRLDYAWNGPLVEQVTWTGEIAGQVGYAWDNNFWLDSLAVNGQLIDYGYDNDGLVTGAGALSLSYAPDVPLLKTTSLGAIGTSWSYNPFGEPQSYQAGLTDGPVLYETRFTRDQLGRITEKVETVNGVQTTYGYAYDAAGRLFEVRENGAVADSYSYDANGNRLSHDGATGIFDDQDRLLSYGDLDYTYSPDGELQTKTDTATGEATQYAYDAFSNLRSVTLPDGTQIEYVIDAQNRRVGKKVNGSLVQGFLYADQLNPIAELDTDGNIDSIFVYASRLNVPDYMIRGGTTYRIISDHLGSVRLVVDSQTGAIAQRIDYSAFGRVIQDTNPGFQPFGFAGGIYDQSTGLVRFGARDYDPEIGRWTTKDPIKFQSAEPNFYEYSFNNPINLLDQNGQEVQRCRAPAQILGGWVDHHWIKTDTKEAGMGGDVPQPGDQSEVPYLTDVSVKDHAGDSKTRPGTKCETVEGADEKIVNDLLEIGKPLGKFSAWNNCQTFADQVLESAETDPAKRINNMVGDLHAL